MTTIDAIFDKGVFRPLTDVELRDQQRVRLTVEPTEASDPADWFSAVREFQSRVMAGHGLLPNCTPEIAADRRRDD